MISCSRVWNSIPGTLVGSKSVLGPTTQNTQLVIRVPTLALFSRPVSLYIKQHTSTTELGTFISKLNSTKMKARTKHYLESLVAGGFGGLLPSLSVRSVFISSVSVCEYWNNNKKETVTYYKRKK